MVFQEFLPVSENSWPLQSLTVAKNWLSEIKPITVKAYGRGWNFYFHLSDFTFQFIQSSEWERRVMTLSLSNPPSQHKCISDWYCPSTGRDARAWSSLLPCLASTVLLLPTETWAISQDSSQQLLVTCFCWPSFVLGDLGIWTSHGSLGNSDLCEWAIIRLCLQQGRPRLPFDRVASTLTPFPTPFAVAWLCLLALLHLSEWTELPG